MKYIAGFKFVSVILKYTNTCSLKIRANLLYYTTYSNVHFMYDDFVGKGGPENDKAM